MTRSLLLAAALLAGGLSLSSCQQARQAIEGVATGAMEPGIDRYGSDYRSFDINRGGPAACQRACQDDTRCRAWTHTIPGYQAEGGMCHLKDAVPGRSTLREATSGVVRR
jgi:hypothetical protein